MHDVHTPALAIECCQIKSEHCYSKKFKEFTLKRISPLFQPMLIFDRDDERLYFFGGRIEAEEHRLYELQLDYREREDGVSSSVIEGVRYRHVTSQKLQIKGEASFG